MSEKRIPPKYDPLSGKRKNIRYRADFLWGNDDGSVEEAGFEFANARTEMFRELWWNILIERIAAMSKVAPAKSRGRAGRGR
jgi:hypothetical protein